MGLLITLFSLSAAVWTIPLLRGGRVISLAMLVLLVSTLFGPLFYSIDGPVQMSLDRIAMVALFGLIAIRWRMGRLNISPQARTDWLVAGIAIWFLIRVLGDDGSGISLWLTFVSMPVGMYAVTRLEKVRDQDIGWFISGLIALGCYLAITAVFEITGFHGLVFPRYIANPELQEFLGRGRGPLLNPVGNGILITMAFVASLIKLIHADRLGKLTFSATTLILVAGIYATLTRSVWVGALLATALIGLVYLPRWVRIIGLAMAVLCAAGFAMGFSDNLLKIKRDKHVTASDAEKSVQLRPLLVVIAYEMFKDRPVAGHGYRRYLKTSIPYHAVRNYDLPLEEVRGYVQHNVLLAILVDTGLIGLSIIVLWLVIVSAIGWQLARGREYELESRMLGLILIGLLATYCCNGMFHDVSIIPMVHMVLFFTGGLAVTRFMAARQTVVR